MARVLWGFVTATLRWTPRRMFGVRKLAAQAIGHQAHLCPTCRISAPWNLRLDESACLGDRVDRYSVDRISIGPFAVVSQDAVLCAATHHHNDPDFPLIPKPINAEARAWIAAGAFIGLGVAIGEGAIVGARAVVFRDIEPWTIVAGNPAGVVGQRAIIGMPEPETAVDERPSQAV